MTAPAELPLNVEVEGVSQLRASGADFLLLDCREQNEYDVAHIDGATLLPMSQLMARAAEIEPHKQRHIVVHCHHGGRSLKVAHWLRQQGFTQVQNMAGGIDAWSERIDPQVPKY